MIMLSTYKHVFDPDSGACPQPDCIMQDVYKVMQACNKIYKAKSVFVPDLSGGCVADHFHTITTKKISNNHS